MGVVKRQGIKATIISYIGVALGTFNLLFLMPKLLDPETIGLLRVILDMAVVLTPIALLGMSSTIIKFLPYYREKPDEKSQFITILGGIILLGSLILSVLLILFKKQALHLFEANSPLVVVYAWTALPIMLLNVFQTYFESYSSTMYLIVVPKISREIVQRLMLTVVVVAYAFYSFGLDMLVFTYVAGFLISFLVVWVYVMNKGAFSIATEFTILKDGFLKKIFDYGIFNFLAGVGNTLVTRLDTLMISALLNLESTGVYSIAMFIGTVVEIPRRAISKITTPLLASAFRNEQHDDILSLYQKTAMNQLIVGGFVLTLIWINVDSIFSLMPNSQDYLSGKYVVLFIGLAKVVNMAMGVNNEIIMMSKHYRSNLVVIVSLMIVAFFTNLWLIPKLGISGAALATLISFCLYNLIRFIYVWVKLKIQPLSWKSLWASLELIGVTAIGLYLPDLASPLFSILYKSVLVCCIYVPMVYFSRVSEDLNKVVDEGYKRLTRK